MAHFKTVLTVIATLGAVITIAAAAAGAANYAVKGRIDDVSVQVRHGFDGITDRLDSMNNRLDALHLRIDEANARTTENARNISNIDAIVRSMEAP